MQGKCKIVLIPADLHEEIVEQTLSYKDEDEAVSCVQDHAKAHFKRIKPRKTPQQLEAQKEAFLLQIPEEQRKGISDVVMEQALGMNMVEHVALLSNATDNNFTGITLYCDDEAVAVGLPHNPRAAEIARCAGKPSEVRGDVFLSRVFDNGDDFRRLDFTLSEISSTAPWVKEAFVQNERKRNDESAAAKMERIDKQSRASCRVTKLTPAEAEKERGNDLFKKCKYDEALLAYSEAIDLDGSLTSAYNNRAMTHLKLGNWRDAEQDASYVLSADPANVKAALRRATAREHQHDWNMAREDYQQVLRFEPNNRIAAAKVEQSKSGSANGAATQS